MSGENRIYFGLQLLTLISLLMLVILAATTPWQDKLIMRQHVLNELAFYFLLVTLVCICGPITDAQTIQSTGWPLIYLLVLFIAVNASIIAVDMFKYIRDFYRRYMVKI
mgnify:CR=1 FL=1